MAVLTEYGYMQGLNFWVGISNVGGGGFVLASDGSSPPYEYWRSNEPSGDGHCVQSVKSEFFGWNDNDCENVVDYLCEKALSGASCDAGWQELVAGKCYITGGALMNKATAEAECSGLGGKLAEPETLEENHAIYNAYFTDLWLGFNDQTVEGTFVRDSDGGVLTFTFWGHNQPDDSYGEDCVNFWVTAAGWSDENCVIASDYICQIDAQTNCD